MIDVKQQILDEINSESYEGEYGGVIVLCSALDIINKHLEGMVIVPESTYTKMVIDEAYSRLKLENENGGV